VTPSHVERSPEADEWQTGEVQRREAQAAAPVRAPAHRTALQRERTGEIKTRKGKIDEHGRNLKTLESEVDLADSTTGVVEVNKPVSSGALTSEVDVVSADGKVWTDNKDFPKTFRPQSDRFAKVKAHRRSSR
jgi:hypothetical protein